MKIKELIALLQTHDPEMEVLVTELLHNEGMLATHEPVLDLVNVGRDTSDPWPEWDHVYTDDLINDIQGDRDAAKAAGEPEAEWPTLPTTRRALTIGFHISVTLDV